MSKLTAWTNPYGKVSQPMKWYYLIQMMLEFEENTGQRLKHTRELVDAGNFDGAVRSFYEAKDMYDFLHPADEETPEPH